MATTNFFDKASLVLVPSGYKAGVIYSQKPDDGTGDFTFSRAAGYSSRTNALGNIEAVADNTPRLQYPKCPALLLEPSRTTGLLRSEDFSTTWVAVNATVNTNVATAPDGTMNADELVDDATDAGHQVYQNVTPTPTGGEKYVFSLFAKANTLDWVCLGLQIDGAFNRNTFFNLSTGQWGVISTYIDDYGFEDFGNGWYRVWVAFTQTNAQNVRHSIHTSLDGISTGYIGSGQSIYIWGAMNEQGTYPTTYIKTEGSSVTRATENGIKTGNFPSSANASFFADFNTNDQSAGVSYLFTHYTTSGNLRSWYINYNRTTFLFTVGVSFNGTAVETPTIQGFDIQNRRVKLCLAIDNDTIKLYIDGQLIGTATYTLGGLFQGSMPVEIFTGVTNDRWVYGEIWEAILFPTALTDEELFDLTNPQWTSYSQMAMALNYTVI